MLALAVLKSSGVGYIVLNLLRGLNIISLLGVIAASIVMLIKTFIINGFFFFDSITHVLTFGFSLFLIFSEVPVLGRIRTWYHNNFPLLSYESGLTPLGLLLIIDGSMVLSNLNSSDVSNDGFGRSYYSTIVAGGLLPFIMGILNIFAGFIFSNSKNKVTARMVRKFGKSGAEKISHDTLYQDQRSYAGTPDIERTMSQHSQAPIMAGTYRPQTARSVSVYSVTTNGRHMDHPQPPAPAYHGMI